MGEANTTIDEIRGVLAHDLRAPVRSARLFADWVIANVPNLSPITAEAAHHLDKSLDVLRLRDVAHHSIEIDPEIQVRAHPELLMRVLSNLMTNSIRYRRDGVPCEITISAATDEDRDIVRLGADG